MNRFLPLVTGLLACALLVVPVRAEDPPKKMTAEERGELVARWKEVMLAGIKAHRAGKQDDAVQSLAEGLRIARRLHPKGEAPDGHPDLVISMQNLAVVYQAQGKWGDAEGFYKDALAMRERLDPGDHAEVANVRQTLALLCETQAKWADAETHARDALAMYKRLFKGDHVEVANSLSKLAGVYQVQGKLTAAAPLYADVVAMRKRLFKGDHVEVAAGMQNLAGVYQAQGKWAEAEALYTDALTMYKRLFRGDHPHLATCLQNLSVLHTAQGKLAEAEPLGRSALDMRKRLFTGDHPDLASSRQNLARLCEAQGKWAEAEALYADALAMYKRLFKGDHRDVATCLNNLADLHRVQGRLAEAAPLYADAIAMRKRLFKGDHHALATSLNNLAGVYHLQGKWADADALARDALAMQKRLFKGDHRDIGASLQNLAWLCETRGKYADAEAHSRDALDMCKRLYAGDHPDLAVCMNNLAVLHVSQGKLAEAETLYADALAMKKRVFNGDHADVAAALQNLAGLYMFQGKWADAEPLSRDALDMSRRLTIDFAKQKAEGEALTYSASLPLNRHVYLSLARTRATRPQSTYDPATVYTAVWAAKGTVARVFELRQLQARAVAEPAVAAALADLAATRRRRAELLLAPATTDPGVLQKRAAEFKALDEKIARHNKALPDRLPAVARADKLGDATSADLRKALPTDAAVVDFVRYTFFEFDNSRPVGQKEKRTDRYMAFVVTRDKVAWVELDTAASVDAAVGAWREAITSGKDVPAAVPAKVRELMWDKVRKELPAHVKVVYVSPDAVLCRVPWAALPGDRPDTILLEDFAVATIPHVPFLLDKLWPQDPLKNPPAGALVVGGVRYDADLAPAAVTTRGADPLVKPGAKLGWSFLPGTAAETTGVSAAATAKELAVTALKDSKATAPAVLAALPKAKYAHFATHGFFADSSFRSVFQLDPKDYEQSQRGERIGRAASSPLVMTGLVFAGANNPATPGRGIVTGESLIDLDLSGLDLAVLSACETGLGDVAGGEGTFGLQRAFHLAGTRDVVASLWKVPDQSTAALMALLYRNLWEKNLPPLEALRQAQLELYKNPGKIADLAERFRGKFEEVPGAGGEVKPSKDGKAHPLLWAAFTLSGPGR